MRFLFILFLFVSCSKFNECPTARCQTTFYTFTYQMVDGKYHSYSDVNPNVQYENVSSCDTLMYKANATKPSSNPITQMLRDTLGYPTVCRCDF